MTSAPCYICGDPMTALRGQRNTRTREHLVPRSKGGKGGENLRRACAACNALKGDLLLSLFIGRVVNRTSRMRRNAARILRQFDSYFEGAEEVWLAQISARFAATGALATHQSEVIGRAVAAAIDGKQLAAEASS